MTKNGLILLGVLSLLALCLLPFGCRDPLSISETVSTTNPATPGATTTTSVGAPANSTSTTITTTTTHATTSTSTPASSTSRIQPADLTYLGAFRLPGEVSPPNTWDYSADGLTYRPDGDPSGAADGYPGSLFGLGHDQYFYVSEISIPMPVISASKNMNDLNTATTLQPFQNVIGRFISGMEVLRGDVCYLPKQGSQATDKLYYCWGQNLQYERVVSHGWSELTLSSPNVQGGWYVGDYDVRSTNDYLFEIPASWANTYTSGRILATGRFKDGGQGGQGPSIFSIGPWKEGNPPAAGTTLSTVPLLLYDPITAFGAGPNKMSNYQNSDEWDGGAWLTSSSKAAVIFVGTKGNGTAWYGYDTGLVWPDDPPYPTVPPAPHDDRGWWSDTFSSEIIFYDPNDLAAVASGRASASSPQPYATLNIDRYLYRTNGSRQKYRVGAVAYDRTHNYLFIMEPYADPPGDAVSGGKSIVHVWKVN